MKQWVMAGLFVIALALSVFWWHSRTPGTAPAPPAITQSLETLSGVNAIRQKQIADRTLAIAQAREVY